MNKKSEKTKKTTTKKRKAGGGRRILKSGVPAAKARKEVAKKIVDKIKKGKTVNIKKIKKEAGYSDKANDISILSRTYHDIINEMMPKEERAKQLRVLTTAKKMFRDDLPKDTKDTDIESWIEAGGGVLHKIVTTKTAKIVFYYHHDINGIAKGLDMLHKVLGDYAPIKTEDVTRPFGDLSDEEIDKLLAKENKKNDKK